MMDGYSVQDAASVLGVPEGRVWELLARGVLAGTPEGDSMRVFLKADAPATSRPAPREELPRVNGNGGSHGGEASAFRELLTEFRNLTERYGQALLALGEARGEVAGLRSRVELLEARIDLRLPARMDAEPISWETPAPPAPAPAVPGPGEVEAALPTPGPVQRASRPRKARSTRDAVAGFAQALARAQDPNVAGLAGSPGATGATEPAAAIVAAPAVESAPEATSVAEVEVVQPETVEAPYRAVEVEPDWFADGDFSWLDAADLEARLQPEVIAIEVAVPASTSREPLAGSAPAPEPIVEAEAPDAAGAVTDLVAEPEPTIGLEPAADREPVTSAGLGQMEPLEVSGTAEEHVAWLGAPSEPTDEMEVAPAVSSTSEPAPRAWDPLEPVAWPASDRGAPTAQAVAPPLAMTEAELAQLARDEGWDDAEVAAIRAMISRPSTAPVELPGSAELDEAMSALQAVPIAPRADAAAGRQWAKPAASAEETGAHDDWAFEVEPVPSSVLATPARSVPHEAAGDPTWLRRRRGPAAEAYRRIRRIFTG